MVSILRNSADPFYAAFEKSKSTNNMGNMNKSILSQLKQNVEKKTKNRGISQYMDNDVDSDDDEF